MSSTIVLLVPTGPNPLVIKSELIGEVVLGSGLERLLALYL
jgi:hypothetical protein